MAKINKLSKILKETRLSRNLSQVKACKQIGISFATYNRLENNTSKFNLSYENIRKVADWLNVSEGEVREWL